MQLSKGANAPLPTQPCRVTLSSPATRFGVSAVLLAAHGKVRCDEDLVFYNHIRQDGVTLDGQTVHLDLHGLPEAVDRIAIVASIDPELPVKQFDAATTPSAVLDCGGTHLTFTPPAFVDRETVAVLTEYVACHQP